MQCSLLRLAFETLLERYFEDVLGQLCVFFREQRCSSVTSWVTWNGFKTDAYAKQNIAFPYFWINRHTYGIKQKTKTNRQKKNISCRKRKKKTSVKHWSLPSNLLPPCLWIQVFSFQVWKKCLRKTPLSDELTSAQVPQVARGHGGDVWQLAS